MTAAPSTALASDGEHLVFRVEGAASGHTPLLTAHGLVSSIHHWMFFTPHFAAQRRGEDEARARDVDPQRDSDSMVARLPFRLLAV